VSEIFELTHQAAEIAFNDYQRWYQYISLYGNKISATDKTIYNHFYNIIRNEFMWSKRRCSECGALMYNNKEALCEGCTQEDNHFKALEAIAYMQNMKHYENDYEPEGFVSAKYLWLYGEDL